MTFPEFVDAVESAMREWNNAPLAIARTRSDEYASWRRGMRWCRLEPHDDDVGSSIGIGDQLEVTLMGDRPMIWSRDAGAADLIAQAFAAYLSRLESD